MAGAPAGPLAGVRLVIKDNIGVEGRRFTAGLPLFADRRADHTAPAAARLMDAGATLVGMTCTDAGGFGVTTPGVRNPLAPDLVVGGSSGGAAAVIAAGEADLGLGTDTGGSVRIPAACTGLYAYKPAYGAVPADGIWPMAPGYDHPGLIARARGTLLTATSALLGAAPPVSGRSAPQSIRIAVEKDFDAPRDPAIAAVLAGAVAVVGSAGHRIVPVALPSRDLVMQAHGIAVLAEAAEVYRDLDEADRDRLALPALKAVKSARHLTSDLLARNRRDLRAIAASYETAFEEADLLLVPTLSVAPPRTDATRVRIGARSLPVLSALLQETCGFNIHGGPVFTLPCALARTDPGIPVSLQLAFPRSAGPEHLALFDVIASLLAHDPETPSLAESPTRP